jgi:hypothetical protein
MRSWEASFSVTYQVHDILEACWRWSNVRYWHIADSSSGLAARPLLKQTFPAKRVGTKRPPRLNEDQHARLSYVSPLARRVRRESEGATEDIGLGRPGPALRKHGHARLSHIGRCGGWRHSIVGSHQTTAVADLPDRRAPTGFGLLQRLCRFSLGVGDLRIGARFDALLDDAEFGVSQTGQEGRSAEHGRGDLGRVGVDEGQAFARLQCRQVRA